MLGSTYNESNPNANPYPSHRSKGPSNFNDIFYILSKAASNADNETLLELMADYDSHVFTGSKKTYKLEQKNALTEVVIDSIYDDKFLAGSAVSVVGLDSHARSLTRNAKSVGFELMNDMNRGKTQTPTDDLSVSKYPSKETKAMIKTETKDEKSETSQTMHSNMIAISDSKSNDTIKSLSYYNRSSGRFNLHDSQAALSPNSSTLRSNSYANLYRDKKILSNDFSQNPNHSVDETLNIEKRFVENYREKRVRVNPFIKEDGREYLNMRTHNRLRWSHVFPSGSLIHNSYTLILV
jgi:hypothetical protein